MSGEAEQFESLDLPVDNLAVAVAWLDETREAYQGTCQEYALRPSAETHTALQTQLEASREAMHAAVLAITETSMDDTTPATVVTLLFHEDTERVTQKRRLTPGVEFVDLKTSRETRVQDKIAEFLLQASSREEFATSVASYLKTCENADLTKFIAHTNQTHAWQATVARALPRRPNHSPITNIVPSMLARETIAATRMALNRCGKLGKFALRFLPE